jgi:cellulose synthase/poly-beta-1,6-N-acetylglucosamine synthase-like glycosyltransferase
MLLKFSLYDLYLLSFVQLLVSTVLVLSPARDIGTRFRWTGSRITEVLLGAVGAAAISAVSAVLAHVFWGVAVGGLEATAYVLVIASVVVMVLQADRNVVGQVFYASFAAASLIFIVYAAYITVIATHTIGEAVTASFVIFLDVAALLVWLSNINYAADVLCRARRGRPLPKADPSYQPMVSLHIPAYNEPPDLLIETIKAAERIDYPDFEIIVMDNNTRDPAVWQPVEEYCRDRPRVKFVHVAPWPGYKAGACNLALRRYTDPRAEIIGLVDADDLVQPYYLKETAGYFADPNIGFVQTFEGNREFEGSPYYTACVDSYQSFYLSVMSSRNERDTVPFVGTMGLFRRSALSAIGGWNEWCISEDTEASLRVLRDGWSGLYIPRCFGRGIVPPSFAGMLTQRHRWCYGAMQILRLHWRSLMPWDRSPDNHMTSAQRRDYLMASVGWFRDLLMLAFSLVLLTITGLLATRSSFYVAPMDGTRSLLPLSLIIIATICMMFSQHHWTTISARRALLSLVISLSVAFVIGRGCIEGVARRNAVFLRTSKAGGRRSIWTALRLVRWETALAVALYVSAGILAALPNAPVVLILIILVQATVYACGPIASVWNLWAQGIPAEKRRLRAERRRRSWALVPRPAAAALGALCLGGVTSAFIAPVSLLHTIVPRTASSQSLLAPSPGTQDYLQLGSGRTYYPITSMHVRNLASSPAQVGLGFDTSSAGLLGQVLRAAAGSRRISHVSIALRAPGADGRPATELVDTFATATVASFEAHLTGQPEGHVSLVLPALASSVSTPGALLQYVGPFAPLPGPTGAPTARTYAALGLPGTGASFSDVTAVTLAQAAPHAPLNLSFATSSLPLLQAVFQDEGAGVTIPVFTLSVRAGPGGPDRLTFSGLSVTSFAENLSGPLSGTATLVVGPR